MIAGIKLDNLSLEEVLRRIRGFLKDGGQHYIVLPYSEFVVQANHDEVFRKIINRSDLSLCDGKGLFFATDFLGKSLKERIAGVDLTVRICSIFPNIFLYGAKELIVKKAAVVLGRNICGFADGYQKEEDILRAVNSLKPEILLVALGMPKQERWIAENLRNIPSVRVAIGVGGAFDFIAGAKKRAPKIIQEAGLEWLWRFVLEPKRIERTLRAVVVFPYIILKEKLIKL